MSNELTTAQQKTSFGSTVMSASIMPAITVGGGAAIAVKAHGGIRNAIKAQNQEAFKNLNKTLKNQGVDMFTRSQAIARGYDEYKNLAKASAKANKKLAKFEKRYNEKLKDLPFVTKIKNAFVEKIYNPLLEKTSGFWVKVANKDNLSVEEYVAKHKKISTTKDTLLSVAEQQKEKTKEILEKADNAIKGVATEGLTKETAETFDSAVKNIDVSEISKKGGILTDAFEFSSKNAAKAAQEATEQGFKTAAKGFGNCFKQNFKNELGWKNGKFNYFMTLLQFIPNIKNDVIPAFKEEGFLSGMKALGVTTLRAAADLVGYSSGGAIGRVLGAAIGNIIMPGVGSRVGAAVGDMLASVVVGSTVTKSVDKILGVKEEDEATQNEQLQQAQPQEIAQVQMQVQPQEQSQEQPQEQTQEQTQDIMAKYANMPSKDEVQRLAYAQAFQGQKGRFNSYYA